MRVLDGQTRACPFCIIPLRPGAEYVTHLMGCAAKGVDKAKVLRERLGLRSEGALTDDLCTEYEDFATHARHYFPDHWCNDEQLENTRVYAVPLDSLQASQVLETIDKEFRGTIRRIERVQNKELYMRHLDYVAAHDDGYEKKLFHASKTDAYNLICCQGFDSGLSRNGSYGYGIYASATMSYSTMYTPKSDGKKVMFLCRVWLTKDSIVKPTIHVLRDDFAIYPEYLIYYE